MVSPLRQERLIMANRITLSRGPARLKTRRPTDFHEQMQIRVIGAKYAEPLPFAWSVSFHQAAPDTPFGRRLVTRRSGPLERGPAAGAKKRPRSRA